MCCLGVVCFLSFVVVGFGFFIEVLLLWCWVLSVFWFFVLVSFAGGREWFCFGLNSQLLLCGSFSMVYVEPDILMFWLYLDCFTCQRINQFLVW